MRLRLPPKVWHSVLAGLGVALLSTAWLWPVPAYLYSAFAYPLQGMTGVTADLYLVLWSLSWDVHALLTDPPKLFRGNMLHPSPFSLAYSEHFLGVLPVFAAPYVATGNPILSLNVVVLSAYVLCFVAMFAFLREWVGIPAAILGAVTFAFTSHRYVVAPYVYLLCTFYWPLLLLAMWRWLLNRRLSSAIACALLLTCQLLVSYYLAYATVVMLLGVALASLLWVSWRKLRLREVASMLGCIGIAVVIFVLLTLPYVRLRSLGIIPEFDEGTVGQPTTLGLVPYFGALRVAHYWRESGPSIVFLLIATGCAWSRRASWGWPLTVGAYCTAMGLILSFGRAIHVGGIDVWSPYQVFSALTPGFSTIRQPIRFIFLFEFGLAILIAFGSERIFGRGPVGWLAMCVTSAVWFVFTFRVATNPIHVIEPTAAEHRSYEWVAEHGAREALLEIPRARDVAAAARRMFLSTLHWSPIFEGYSAYFPRTDWFFYGLADRLPSTDALKTLVEFGSPGWILVHLDELAPEKRAIWERDEIAPELRVVHRWEGGVLLRVLLKERDRSAELFDESHSLEGAPLEPLGRDCPGAMAMEGGLPHELRPGTRVRIPVRIENRSEVTWPGNGFVPRYLIRARCEVFQNDGRRLSAESTALPSDVPPGATVRMGVDCRLPKWPGEYGLELALEQVMHGPLARCGVAPVERRIKVE